MKKVMFVIVILSLLTACGPAPTYDIQATIAMGMDQTRAAEPTATFTPEPTPDIQATINAGIAATQAAQPIPTSPPAPTETELPQPIATSTPQVEASYAVFLDKYKANFEAMKSNMTTPVTSTIHKIDFEENDSGTSTLWIETAGNASDISPTLLGFTVGVLTGLMSAQPGDPDYVPIVLPEDLELVRLVFRDEALVERGHFFTTWAELLEYNNKQIEFIDVFNNSDWDLP